MSNPLVDMEKPDVIFCIGTNMTECHPVAATRLKRAVAKGAKMIVADADTVDETFTRSGLLLSNGDQVDLDDLEQSELGRIIDELTADPARLVDRRCETASGIPIRLTRSAA